MRTHSGGKLTAAVAELEVGKLPHSQALHHLQYVCTVWSGRPVQSMVSGGQRVDIQATTLSRVYIELQ